MSENRKHERFSISQAIEYSLGREEFIAAKGINISEGGLLFEADHQIEILTQLYFLLSVPLDEESYSLELEGVVRHVRKNGKKYRTGVEFFSLKESEVKILNQYLKEIG